MPATQTPLAKPVNMLLVEDNHTDIYFIREALKRCRFSIRLGIAYNGEEALAYLRHQGSFLLSVDPDIILLDLNLPKKNGWEVLTEMKKDPRLNGFPVIIITTPGSVEDARRAYQLNADSYIVKPPNMIQFPMLVMSIEKVLKDFFRSHE